MIRRIVILFSIVVFNAAAFAVEPDEILQDRHLAATASSNSGSIGGIIPARVAATCGFGGFPVDLSLLSSHEDFSMVRRQLTLLP